MMINAVGEKKAQGEEGRSSETPGVDGRWGHTILNKAAKTYLTETVIKINLSKDSNTKKVRE